MRRKNKIGSPKDLLERAKNGEVFAASRLMTLAARGDKKAKKLVGKLPNLPRETFLIGVTGSGGVGKSTLISGIIRCFRKEGKTIGVVACDPVSVSGGAVLGDRIRMQGENPDDGIFIRSLAQYEDFKGVTAAVPYIIKIFGAVKKDVVIIETVGVGQGNLGFRDLVEILIWVAVPGVGDEIQALKGGTIETADIIVINQSDRPGAEIAFSHFLNAFGSSKKICKTDSLSGGGITELVEIIKEHKKSLQNKAAN